MGRTVKRGEPAPPKVPSTSSPIAAGRPQALPATLRRRWLSNTPAPYFAHNLELSCHQTQKHFLSSDARMSPAEALRQACELLTIGDLASASETLDSAFPAASAQTPCGKWALPRFGQGLRSRRIHRPLLRRAACLPLNPQSTFGARAVCIPIPPELAEIPHASSVLDALPNHRSRHPRCSEGGPDDESNVVTTSMVRNAAKGNWLPSELGWPSERTPVRACWDGLLPWFCREYERNERLRRERSLQQWYRAAMNAA